jgi:choline kinase
MTVFERLNARGFGGICPATTGRRRDVVVARGYVKDKINLPSIRTVDNDLYASTGKAASPACAVKHIRGRCFVTYGDILFRHHYRDQSMDSNDHIAIAADAPWTERRAAVARAGRLP